MTLEVLGSVVTLANVFAVAAVAHLHLTIDKKLAQFENKLMEKLESRFLSDREARQRFSNIEKDIDDLQRKIPRR